jgi:hypothetical protein
VCVCEESITRDISEGKIEVPYPSVHVDDLLQVVEFDVERA